MKKIRLLPSAVLAANLLLCAVFSSCDDGVKCNTYKKVLEVEPHHATRVMVKYVSTCNDTIWSSEHQSATIKAENITFDISDFLNGKRKYGLVK